MEKLKKQETEFDKYYSEMYKLAQYMGTEKLFYELYLSSIQLKNNNKALITTI